jgi:uncharacterized membrane protein YfcA
MIFDIALYLAVGAGAGLLAGLLGVGGGLIIVAALAWLLPARGFALEHVMQVALATSLASIVLTSISSASAHWRRGSVLWTSVRSLVPGMILGGLAGAQVASRLPSDVLRWIVAGYCLIAAAQLLFGRMKAAREAHDAPHGPALFAAGIGIGALSAIVGIGGGSMTVPLLVYLGVAPVRAVGTSAACGFAIAVASAAGFVWGGHAVGATMPPGSLGFIYLPAALGCAVASVLVAPLGVRLAHALSGEALKRVFAAFLVLMGLAVGFSG